MSTIQRTVLVVALCVVVIAVVGVTVWSRSRADDLTTGSRLAETMARFEQECGCRQVTVIDVYRDRVVVLLVARAQGPEIWTYASGSWTSRPDVVTQTAEFAVGAVDWDAAGAALARTNDPGAHLRLEAIDGGSAATLLTRGDRDRQPLGPDFLPR